MSEYTWEAEDKKNGMTVDEIQAGIGRAKIVFPNQHLEIRARLGWGGQIQKMIARPSTKIEATEKNTSGIPFAPMTSRDQQHA